MAALQEITQALAAVTMIDTSTPRCYDATHAVLFTNGLLRDIANYLPLHDLIAATGVCQAWCEAIKSDAALRQSLFLTPAPIRKVMVWDDDIPDLEQVTDIVKANRGIVVGQVHPYLGKVCGPFYTEIHDHVNRVGDDLHPLSDTFPDFDRPQGIWRTMFMSQPPCEYVRIVLCASDDPFYGLFSCLRRKGGIKLGDVHDFVQSQLCDLEYWGKYRYDRIASFSQYVEDCDELDRIVDFRVCKVRNGEVCRPEPLPDGFRRDVETYAFRSPSYKFGTAIQQ